MTGDENGDDTVSVRTYTQSKCHPNSAWLLLRTVTEESEAQNRHSWVSLDRSPPTWPGRLAIWSDLFVTISVPYHIPRGGGGGLPQKRGRGVSGPRPPALSGPNATSTDSNVLVLNNWKIRQKVEKSYMLLHKKNYAFPTWWLLPAGDKVFKENSCAILLFISNGSAQIDQAVCFLHRFVGCGGFASKCVLLWRVMKRNNICFALFSHIHVEKI